MVEVNVSCRRGKRAMLLAVAIAEQKNRGLDMLMRAVSLGGAQCAPVARHSSDSTIRLMGVDDDDCLLVLIQ